MKIQLIVEYYNKKKKILIAKYSYLECKRKTDHAYLCNYNGAKLHIPLNSAIGEPEPVKKKKKVRKSSNLIEIVPITSQNQGFSRMTGAQFTCGVKPKKSLLLCIPTTVRG